MGLLPQESGRVLISIEENIDHSDNVDKQYYFFCVPVSFIVSKKTTFMRPTRWSCEGSSLVWVNCETPIITGVGHEFIYLFAAFYF